MTYSTKASIGRISKLQKTSVRIISDSKYNSDTEPLFRQLNLLKIHDIFVIQQYQFYHKFLSNENFKTSFSIAHDRRHAYNTRLQSDLCLPRIQHEFIKKTHTV